LIGETTQLGGGLDISSKENKSAGLDSLDELGILGINLQSWDAEEQELTRGRAFHSV
jgi:hypothetical protein